MMFVYLNVQVDLLLILLQEQDLVCLDVLMDFMLNLNQRDACQPASQDILAEI
jgi:hypothetical protein